jgi:hypothetical protein
MSGGNLSLSGSDTREGILGDPPPDLYGHAPWECREHLSKREVCYVSRYPALVVTLRISCAPAVEESDRTAQIKVRLGGRERGLRLLRLHRHLFFEKSTMPPQLP